MANYTLFKTVLQKTEGFLSRNPQDTGGMTYKGIARNYHPNWPGWTIIDFQIATNSSLTDKALSNKLKGMTYLEQLVDDFYRPMWNRLGANQLSQDLANLYADWYVHKPADAVRAMQSILNSQFGENLSVDGVPGPNTNAAVKRHDSDKLYNALRAARLASYQSKQSSSPTFWQSWVNRVKKHFPEKSIASTITKGMPVALSIGALVASGLLLKHFVQGEQQGKEGRAVSAPSQTS